MFRSINSDVKRGWRREKAYCMQFLFVDIYWWFCLTHQFFSGHRICFYLLVQTLRYFYSKFLWHETSFSLYSVSLGLVYSRNIWHFQMSILSWNSKRKEATQVKDPTILIGWLEFPDSGKVKHFTFRAEIPWNSFNPLNSHLCPCLCLTYHTFHYLAKPLEYVNSAHHYLPSTQELMMLSGHTWNR